MGLESDHTFTFPQRHRGFSLINQEESDRTFTRQSDHIFEKCKHWKKECVMLMLELVKHE